MLKVREGPTPRVCLCVWFARHRTLILSGKKKESRPTCADPSSRSLGTLQQEELLITTLKPRHLNAKG